LVLGGVIGRSFKFQVISFKFLNREWTRMDANEK
jgi:hypothetical protein